MSVRCSPYASQRSVGYVSDGIGMFVIGTELTISLNVAVLAARPSLSHCICSADTYCGELDTIVDGLRSLRQSSTKISSVLPQREERQIRRVLCWVIGA